MEAHIAGAAATVGVLISIFLLWDSITDVRVALLSAEPALHIFAVSRLIGEIIRFLVQVLYLIAVILSLAGDNTQTVIWLLVAFPILMTLGSVVSYVTKVKVLAQINGTGGG